MKDKFKGLILGFIIGASTAATGVLAANGGVWKELYYNDIKVTLNGETVALKDSAGNDAEPFIIDGTTYLPVRAVSNALGLYVDWDSASNTVKLSETDFSDEESNDAYSKFNGAYSGGGTTVPGESYKIGVWHANITDVAENSLHLSFSQSESDYYVEDAVLYRQEDGSYYGEGNSSWGTSYITIWFETDSRIALAVSGDADQTGTEYLYK